MADAQNSEQPIAWDDFDLADRLKRSLRLTGIGVSEMAESLDVERGTIGNWINGRIVPRRTALMAWALRTGAPFEWLLNGSGHDKAPDPSGPGAEAECTPWDLNPEPTD